MSGRRGTALVGAVAIAALVLGLAATGLLAARDDLLFARNLRDGTATYFQTRGVAVRVVAALPAGYGFDALLRGADGIRGTDDDGTVPDAVGSSSCTAHAGRVVANAVDPETQPLADGNQRVLLHAACSGPGGARRSIEAVVTRAPQPFVPGALYLERADVEATAPVVLDGGDHTAGDAPGRPSGPLAGLPAAAGGGLEAAVPLPGDVTDGRGLAVAVEPAGRIDAGAFAMRLLASGTPLTAELSPAALASPVVHVPGSARVVVASVGRGLLAVDGALRVDAPLEFAGVVVVGGVIEIAATGSLAVRGWLWVRGAGPGPAIRAAGPLVVRFGSDAVADADARMRLPRHATLDGEREL